MMIAAALVCWSCGSSPVTPAGSPLKGVIVARNTGSSIAQGNPTVHMKTDSTDACGVVFSVNSNTELRRRISSGGTRTAVIDEFTVGALAKAWAPVVAESCPAQAVATLIELQ